MITLENGAFMITIPRPNGNPYLSVYADAGFVYLKPHRYDYLGGTTFRFDIKVLPEFIKALQQVEQNEDVKK